MSVKLIVKNTENWDSSKVSLEALQFVITTGIEGCHNDKHLYHQIWQNWHHVNSVFSEIYFVTGVFSGDT